MALSIRESTSVNRVSSLIPCGVSASGSKNNGSLGPRSRPNLFRNACRCSSRESLSSAPPTVSLLHDRVRPPSALVRCCTNEGSPPRSSTSAACCSRETPCDLTALRRIVVAAAPVPPRTLRAYSERGIKMCQGYGLTESGPGATILTSVDAERKMGTAGVPHTFTDVRIVDATSRTVAPGERGEIQIHGPNVMKEYWGRPDSTADVFDDGWLRTGDIGVADDEGFVTIVDRLKDLIISGGENIYPAEVEAAILELPGIEGCAVFGVPDEKWGESALAAITVSAGSTVDPESLASALGVNLARYKIPKRYIVFEEIPRNPTGKIRKDVLRAQFANANVEVVAQQPGE
ncbi:hypothetical protein CH306_02510 [Rhodococcus sp. 15-725-2-2b]|nr:hypothetical protein CH277_00785 [Rhodococcus sp. 06-469-3-2]OZD48790.1 hypothetical protein CH264_06010 [Rhodococcus sp. 06-1477-1A]OZE77573.1 hypothetical protein CH306_02510 [Rhodococcus sp. 15-725-2-2b]